VIPDLDMLERRIAAMRDVPWPIPALVIIEMTDEDLDNLDAAADADNYWTVLNAIVSRIEREAA
jgi:phage FluMu protein gp41